MRRGWCGGAHRRTRGSTSGSCRRSSAARSSATTPTSGSRRLDSRSVRSLALPSYFTRPCGLGPAAFERGGFLWPAADIPLLSNCFAFFATTLHAAHFSLSHSPLLSLCLSVCLSVSLSLCCIFASTGGGHSSHSGDPSRDDHTALRRLRALLRRRPREFCFRSVLVQSLASYTDHPSRVLSAAFPITHFSVHPPFLHQCIIPSLFPPIHRPVSLFAQPGALTSSPLLLYGQPLTLLDVIAVYVPPPSQAAGHDCANKALLMVPA